MRCYFADITYIFGKSYLASLLFADVFVLISQICNFCFVFLRRLYMKASSFQEKQRWVAAMEVIVSTNVNSSRIQDINVLGNTILHLPKDRWLEINCTWPLNDEVSIRGSVTS